MVPTEAVVQRRTDDRGLHGVIHGKSEQGSVTHHDVDSQRWVCGAHVFVAGGNPQPTDVTDLEPEQGVTGARGQERDQKDGVPATYSAHRLSS